MVIRKITLGVAAASAALCVYAQQGKPAGSFRTPQDAARYYENLTGRLAQQVRSMQDENAMLAASNAELKQRVARLENDTRALADEIAALRKKIAADAEVRKNQLNRLADKLSENNRPEKKPQAARPEKKIQKGAAPAAPAAEEVEYIEHVVEKGTTLNALAKAYGVKVAEIIKANKLKNTNIYVGQKLLIPAPKKQ